jgi:peptide/nickel transport system permease protein
MIVVLFAVSILAYVMLFAIGNPVYVMMGGSAGATPEQIEELTRALGLDQPAHIQYGRFVVGVVTRGDFGRSFYFGQPALQLILERLPASLLLSLPPLFIGALLSIPLGVTAARRRGTWTDRIILGFSMIGLATPVFWLAVILIYVFAVVLQVLPSSGYGRPEHLVLPLVGLTTTTTAILTRLVRTEMLEVLSKDYVRTAHAKGLSDRSVTIRHALRNSMIPFVTYLGLMTGNVLGNTVITEKVFAWPGTGRLLLTSIERLDQPVVVTFVVLIALLFMLVNFIVDLSYMLLDPRIRYGA